MARKCSTITIGHANCRPMTQDEFNALKEGDEVLTNMGGKSTFIGFAGSFAKLEKTRTANRTFYHLYELVVKNN